MTSKTITKEKRVWCKMDRIEINVRHSRRHKKAIDKIKRVVRINAAGDAIIVFNCEKYKVYNFDTANAYISLEHRLTNNYIWNRKPW